MADLDRLPILEELEVLDLEDRRVGVLVDRVGHGEDQRHRDRQDLDDDPEHFQQAVQHQPPSPAAATTQLVTSTLVP